MMIKRPKILNEFSPKNALEMERELSRFHRSKGGYGYSQAVEKIQKVIGDSKVLKYPAGKVYNSWNTPVGWNLRGGFLRTVNPKKYIVSDLSLSPISAIFMSGPSNGIEKLKVIDVGSGESEEDYSQSVKGCAVLSNGNISRVYDLAVEKFGARCVLSHFMRAQVEEIGRTPELMPQAVNYTSFPAYSKGEAFGFALTYKQYKWMKSRSRSGKLEVEARMDVDRGTDDLEILEARFGKSENEKPLLLIAHLCHPKPGANDNASGSALLTEIVRVLKKTDLNREIVALWVPEMYGTAAYLTDHVPDFELGVNLDMVGEDQCKTGSVLQVSSTPWSLPSFISELLFVNLETDRFRIKTGKYSGGSDHFILSDSTVKIPTTSLTQWPDRFYHSSEDTTDKSSVESFEWIGKGVLNSIMDLTYEMPHIVATKISANILKEFIVEYNTYEEPVIRDWMVTRARRKLRSLSKYADVKSVLNMIEKYSNFRDIPEKSSNLRRIKGPVADSWMNSEDREWFFKLTRKLPAWRDYKDELLNFMEIGFSVEDAIKLASCEFEISVDVSEDSRRYIKRLSEESIINL